MKKIVLNVETLAVESFVAEAEPGDKHGTVHGHATRLCGTNYCTLGYDTCQQASCLETCGYPYKPAC